MDISNKVMLSSSDEKACFARFAELASRSPVPDGEKIHNSGLFLTAKNLARILFFNEIYRKIVGLHGVIIEFGVRWGQTLSVLAALRAIYEPFNRHRRIIGFDTFSGFCGLSDEDGHKCGCTDGSYAVTPGYSDFLREVLTLQEQMNPIGHIRRFELVEGDVCETVRRYFDQHPETIVSLAIFDLDIYKPTREALAAVRERIGRGSVLVFDELCDDIFPGETVALREVFDLAKLRIRRFPFAARLSYVVME
ncbi:MAG: crotonobetainyl-CoA--carnitine CoA-transferase [Negativicutes bacterium]|nr:crotonobetainyl-CoA--carnitine CoA-transferase [Negativicutes bacterium]